MRLLGYDYQDTVLLAGAADAAPGAVLHALSLCGEGVLLVDADPARFTIAYANPAFCRLYGDAAGALSGLALAQLDTAGAGRKLADAAAALADGGERSVILQTRRSDGVALCHQVRVSPVPAGPGRQVARLVCVASPQLIEDQLAAMPAVGHGLHLAQKQQRTLLLVDDEPNIVSALKRLLRRDDYRILTAHSGQEGLDVLAANGVDVIVSDQRMPGMIGADFLRAAKGLYPDTIRIMLSGYTELQSVTDAVNEGAIFKFLTKPWDDEQLRSHIAEAFRLKEIADDNERLNLELRTANNALAATNRRMEALLRQKQQQISRDEVSLSVARELLQFVPLAVIGLDDMGMIAFLNAAAAQVFLRRGAILGAEASVVLPELFAGGGVPGTIEAAIDGLRYQVVAHSMGEASQSRGCLITLSPREVQSWR